MSNTAEYYSYDPVNGNRFTFSGIADKNVMEIGRFLHPANSLPVAPPETGENECAVARSGQWVVVPDFLGTKYWLEDGSYHIITEVGEVVLDNASLDFVAAPLTLEQIRDNALMSVVYDFGDGRIMQARLTDKANIEFGIALGLTEWKMADNKRWSVTTAELETVLAHGISEGVRIWADHLAALPAGE